MDSSKLKLDVQATSPPVISAAGELDYENCKHFDNVFRDLASTHGPHINLCLSGLEFVDSSGLRALVTAALDSQKTGGQVTIVSLNSQLRRMLDISGCTNFF